MIHRDDWVIALDKPSGLAVQGGSGAARHVDGMLDALVSGRFAERPRLVHRLDRDTCGLLVVARTGKSAKGLMHVFRDRRVRKLYWAVVVGGRERGEGVIDLPLAKRPGARDRETMQVDREEGQKALTHFRVMDRAASRAALLALWPRTGRTHQLRVHCAEIGCPILGDRKYGGEEALLSAVAEFPQAPSPRAAHHAAPSGGQGHATCAGRAAASLSPYRRGIRLLDDGRLNETGGRCEFPGGQ